MPEYHHSVQRSVAHCKHRINVSTYQLLVANVIIMKWLQSMKCTSPKQDLLECQCEFMSHRTFKAIHVSELQIESYITDPPVFVCQVSWLYTEQFNLCRQKRKGTTSHCTWCYASLAKDYIFRIFNQNEIKSCNAAMNFQRTARHLSQLVTAALAARTPPRTP